MVILICGTNSPALVESKEEYKTLLSNIRSQVFAEKNLQYIFDTTTQLCQVYTVRPRRVSEIWSLIFETNRQLFQLRVRHLLGHLLRAGEALQDAPSRHIVCVLKKLDQEALSVVVGEMNRYLTDPKLCPSLRSIVPLMIAEIAHSLTHLSVTILVQSLSKDANWLVRKSGFFSSLFTVPGTL
eukprot:TRINITY_DN5016_c0_g1_i9.p1 TRINITY_DN5016_c0_g1~~TRINITY_DN5016_c0_g1_i9.p1  ORF type:complete len:183 (-),score=8.99 TRINITY_DN5016_c0_g1_i9:598-1146(-)